MKSQPDNTSRKNIIRRKHEEKKNPKYQLGNLTVPTQLLNSSIAFCLPNPYHINEYNMWMRARITHILGVCVCVFGEYVCVRHLASCIHNFSNIFTVISKYLCKFSNAIWPLKKKRASKLWQSRASVCQVCSTSS